MTHVYVAESGDYEQRGIDGIYSSREKALEAYPNSAITIYALDDADISLVPCVWEVSYLPEAIPSGKHRWKASRTGLASKVDEEVTWLKWNLQNPTYPINGEVRVEIWAATKDEAIAGARTKIRGLTIPIVTYDWVHHGAVNPWRRTGEGVALPGDRG